MDLLPTFARLAGGREPQDRTIDGHDIRPLLFGAINAATPYDVFYYYYMQQLQAVRSGPWKLFLPEASERHPHLSHNVKSRELLFNLIDDISCKNDVSDDHPEIVDRLMKLAERGRTDLGDTNRSGNGQRLVGKLASPTARVKPNAVTTN